eukprot:TRINITY_DN2546_c0_g1_i1.p1 TRINITY_DN2546_c0_g1~~TRINITY_DN2546_c0_g1_i1.p1  ORF type:complete len:987 (+),score=150.93 TRINITY_DN2546_c0_g1_i1:2424-5384(+)
MMTHTSSALLCLPTSSAVQTFLLVITDNSLVSDCVSNMDKSLQRRQNIFFQKKKSGIAKVIREVYLREDIPCGANGCVTCGPGILEMDAPFLLIPDTNVCLQQIDLLESPLLRNIVLLAVVLEEVRHLNRGTYARLKGVMADQARAVHYFSNEFHQATHVDRLPGETMNDRNDRAIRSAAEWYMRHLPNKAPPIVLLTRDVANKDKARTLGIKSMAPREFIREFMHDNVQLLDRMNNSSAAAAGGPTGEEGIEKGISYPTHQSLEALQIKIKQGAYFQGKLYTNSYNCQQATVRVSGSKTFPEVLVQGLLNLNRALDGDVVAVEMLPPSQWQKASQKIVQADDAEADLVGELDVQLDLKAAEQKRGEITAEQALREGCRPTGRVVGIVKSGRRPYCGTVLFDPRLSVIGSQKLLFAPISKKIPRIRISTHQADALRNKRLVVVIDDWREDSRYPDGHYIKILGEVGDKDVEAEVVLLENDIPHYEFSKAVLDCLPPDDWKITDEERAKRWDLRDRAVCSVDPPGCRDIDDALHCVELPNGLLEVGVHIADVTHFLHEGTALDEEARKRCTSVYLVDRRIDMLPKLLTEVLCSVRGGEESLVFSVIWTMTKQAEVRDVKFGKAVVLSRAALSYQNAWERIQDNKQQDPVSQGLRHLLGVSKVLKKRRMDAGALDLESSEMRVVLDRETGATTEVKQYEKFPTCSMIEEFMLLANVEVARFVQSRFPSVAFLRRHQAPQDTAFDGLNEALKRRGFHLDVSSSKALSDSLDRCTDPSDPVFNSLVRMLATRCMQQAKYFVSGDFDTADYYHYGLASPIYTHFTSPIRRYADDIVHRQLAVCLGIAPIGQDMQDKERMGQLAEMTNYRHTQAQWASRDSTNLFTGFFFKDKVVLAYAYVIRERQNGVVVFIPKYGIEAIIWLDEAGANPTSCHIFDKVEVEIKVVSDESARNKLCVTFAPEGSVPVDTTAVSQVNDDAPKQKKRRTAKSS